MKEEASSLEPVLLARKEEIDAVFALQETRTKRTLIRERFWGFIIGVVATLIASSIISIAKSLMTRRKNTQKAST
jgi:hypothetical protein